MNASIAMRVFVFVRLSFSLFSIDIRRMLSGIYVKLFILRLK